MLELDKIYNEDCLIGMHRIQDKSVDCIICDLPYGTTAYPWDSVIPFEPLWEQYHRVLKPQGSILLFGSEPFSTKVRMSNFDEFKYDWIWQKDKPTGFQHAKNMPMKDFEIISVFSPASMGHENLLGDKRMIYNPQGIVPCHKVKTNAKRSFGGVYGARPSHKDTIVSEATNYPTATLAFSKDSDAMWHPTSKPVALIRYLILTYTNNVGDVVLDNCMGSGTTAIAAIKEKRHFIGFELNKEYFDKAVRRIKAEQQQLSLF